jgi:hypothetical protein
MYIDAFEDATGVKVKDRNGFMTAMKGLVNSCSEGGDTDGEEDEDEGQGKGMPGVAIMLGKMSKMSKAKGK